MGAQDARVNDANTTAALDGNRRAHQYLLHLEQGDEERADRLLDDVASGSTAAANLVWMGACLRSISRAAAARSTTAAALESSTGPDVDQQCAVDRELDQLRTGVLVAADLARRAVAALMPTRGQRLAYHRDTAARSLATTDSPAQRRQFERLCARPGSSAVRTT